MGQSTEKRLQAYMPIGDLEKKRDFNFTDIRGFQVLNTTGHKVGTVKEIYVDPNTLEPGFAFIDYGKITKLLGHNTKHLLVEWSELKIGDDFVQTRWTEETLSADTQAEQDKNLAGRKTEDTATSGSAR
jgi:sporulation protein YlmC with PRC-barrel domain